MLYRLILLGSLAALLSHCIEAVEPTFRPVTGRYLVDATITTDPGENSVQVSRLQLRDGRVKPITERDSRVTIEASSGETTNCFYNSETDRFAPPTGWRASVGVRYALCIEIGNGDVITSEPQEVLPPVVLDSVSVSARQESVFDPGRNRFIPTYDLAAHFADPPGRPNFYRLNFTRWERIVYCRFCPSQTRYDAVGDRCERTGRSHRGWSYPCDRICYGIEEADEIKLYRDEFSDGEFQRNVPAGSTPFFGPRTDRLFRVRLFHLAASDYEYANSARQLSEESGGLNATLPAVLIGNLSLEGAAADATVLGNVTVASVSSGTVFVPARSFPDIAPLNIRQEFFEEPATFDRPPLAPCDGPNRTPVRPEGWRE